jgi:RNA polymerase sigma-70 factor (ECF subfamily)
MTIIPSDPRQLFEPHRRYLTGVAYRMLGTVADAEDVVQDAYLRWSSSPVEEVASPRAYLTKVVVRLCLDQLKAARRVRETYVGPWLPEPVLTEAPPPSPSASGRELVEDLSVGLLLLLERLSPLERAAFLLHDVFEMDFATVADVLESSTDACRQLAARARQHVRLGAPRFQPSTEELQQLAAAFVTAMSTGDVQGLTALLASDALLISDGGGRRAAALRPIQGADRVARFFIGVAAKYPDTLRAARVEFATVNGLPGWLVFREHEIDRCVMFDLAPDRRVRAIYMVLNPDKLRTPLVAI